MLILAGLTAACCVGCLGFFRPFVDQYPATVVIEADVPGLSRSNDTARRRSADELLPLIESKQLGEQSFRVVYADARQRPVIVFGATRFVADPKADLESGIARLTERLRLTGVRIVDPGPMGGQSRCATGALKGQSVSTCAWADHGTIAVGVFTGRSVTDAAASLRTIRETIVRRG
jgi:hypothetical protein